MSRGLAITQADTSTLGDASFYQQHFILRGADEPAVSVCFVPQLRKGMPPGMTSRTGLNSLLKLRYRGKGKRNPIRAGEKSILHSGSRPEAGGSPPGTEFPP